MLLVFCYILPVSQFPVFPTTKRLILGNVTKNVIFATLVRSLWEGNVFSHVCLFTEEGFPSEQVWTDPLGGGL